MYVNLLILIILGGGKLHADQTQSSALKINTTGGQADGQHLSSSSTSIGSSATAPTSSSSSHKHSSSGSSASKSASKSAGKGSSSSESKSSKSESHHHRSSSHHSSSKSKSSQHERYLSITICTVVIRELRPEFKFPAKIEMVFSQIISL